MMETKAKKQSILTPVLEALDKDLYEEATSLCEGIIYAPEEESEYASAILGIIEYLKWFSKGYRKWQVSYDYNIIRSFYWLANLSLREYLYKGKEVLSPDLGGLFAVFSHLTKMLDNYTWCENSFINNDPFAWENYTGLAVIEEKEALLKLYIVDNLIKEDAQNGSILREVSAWLRAYLEKNKLLHSGSNLCAKAYIQIYSHQCSMQDNFVGECLRTALEYKDQLELESSELASELWANIQHIQRHYDRIKNGQPTYLVVTNGKLVLNLSASFRTIYAKKLLNRWAGSNAASDNAPGAQLAQGRDRFLKEFEEAIKGKIDAEINLICQDNMPQDIFETSLGRELMETIVIELPDVSVYCLGIGQSKKFTFNTALSLSAFGVCTISFSLDIYPRHSETWLTVEEVRSIQALICPHAGQVKLETPYKNVSAECNLNDIIDLERLHELIEMLNAEAPQTFEGKAINIDWDFIGNIRSELYQAKIDNFRKIKAELDALYNILKTNIQNIADKAINGNYAERLDSIYSKRSYLRQVAQEYLQAAKSCISKVVGRDDKIIQGEIDKIIPGIGWHIDPDTGWYSYLYSTRIDEVYRLGAALKRSVSFNEMIGHADMPGFIINTREARAGFDDWRFLLFDINGENNLAKIRSHISDAMYCDEFQAFIYLPDDPQFLTDQYETTVKVMMRLMHALRCHHYMVDAVISELKIKFKGQLDKDSKKKLNTIGEIVRATQLVEWESREMCNLISKVGFSRYRDHADLLVSLTKEMKIDLQGDTLQRDMKFLQGLLDYFERSLKKKSDRISFKQSKKVKTLFQAITVALTLNSALNIVGYFFKVKDQTECITSVLVLIVLFSVLIGLILKSNKIDE